MKTLYTRIVVTFMLIALASGIVGLLLTSAYYEMVLREDNEAKMLGVADNIRELTEYRPTSELDATLTRIAGLGYQIYAVPPGRSEGRTYGSPFKRGTLSADQLQKVRDGGVYRGMSEEDHRLQLIAFFENSVRNTVGIPVETADGVAALFVRADLQQQIGEVRLIVAFLLVGTFVVSLVLIVILSRFIVRPIQKLTQATNRIAEGRFDVDLAVSRKDEIGNLARHFSRMAQAIGQLDARRQAFVANVSHEFQTPLTSMQGFARAALAPGTTEGERERYLTVIAEESERLSKLSKQLLTLAFLDKDNADLRRAPYRLDEQIRQILITLEWQWSDRELTLDLDLPETTIAADGQLLHEVWLNLLTNAIKFSDPGGIVSVRIVPEETGLRVEIGDTGAGIPEADLPLIFERFHKADRSRGREGSGLGLSISRKIIELHGGAIAVRSEPGAGTVFTVTLPRL